jgi:hypothetical protein
VRHERPVWFGPDTAEEESQPLYPRSSGGSVNTRTIAILALILIIIVILIWVL